VSHDEMRTGRLTRRLLDLERSMSFWETPSREETLRKVRVMRVLWILDTLLCGFHVRPTVLSWPHQLSMMKSLQPTERCI
jgi:hypothetical protein